MEHPALELRQVTVRYGSGAATRVTALERATLAVAAGECVVVAGGPGAGVTSLLLCAAGLVGPDEGSVRWFGSHCWSAARPAYARAAAEGHQYLSVRAWLEFAAAQVADAAGPEPDVARAMALAELREFSQIRVGHLTRGIGARVALAGALLGTPHIVCLDRPFDVLMDAERARFAQVLAGVRRTGITVVVGTRDVSAVVAVAADRMHLMAGGRVGPAAGRDAALELDVPLPVEARSRLALRVPTVYRRGRALRVPLGRVSPEQVLSECRALGIEVRASRVIPHEQASRRRVAEPAPARPGRAV